MTACEVCSTIVPDVPVCPGQYAEYCCESRTICLPHPDSKGTDDLAVAAHEAIHAWRHQQGVPFYAAFLAGFEGDSRIAWNEEAIEERRTNDAAEAWALAHLSAVCDPDKLRQEFGRIQDGAILPSKGYISRWAEDECIMPNERMDEGQ